MSKQIAIINAEPSARKQIAVGISASYGEDSDGHGFDEEEMNASVVRLADDLLRAGYGLVFGHDWRPKGIMAAIGNLAIRYEAPTENTDPPTECRITNLVPWGSPVELPREQRENLERRGVLRIVEVGLPPMPSKDETGSDAVMLRAIGLSFMRDRQADLCQARICLGGKYKKYEGLWPGIPEEVWRSLRLKRPVYLSRMLNGAAAQILDCSRGHKWEANPDVEEAKRPLREKAKALGSAVPLPTEADFVEGFRWEQFEHNSGLSAADWKTLTETKAIAVISALILKGLKKVFGPQR